MFGHRTIEHGDDEKREEGGDRQTADDDDTERLPHLCAFTFADRHRDHTQNGGESRHEHRAQTGATGHLDSVIERISAFAHQVDIVHEHDTVLHHNTDQQYDTEGTDHIE